LRLRHDGNIIDLSTSIGLSGSYGDHHAEISELIYQADKALYLVKKSGGDKSVIFEK
jgi:GGDEF domain-containing protein